ncbi:hypothetical protein LQZ19_04995 [Treponema primitia]|uniref:hypothetical protein n=1 Tax=Treponema primitia TaxID=88058 RepID=UPI00397F228F
MTKKEFEEELLDKLTLSFRRKLPSGGKIEFYANPKKYHEEITEEKKAFWNETRAWVSGNGQAPENTVIDYPDSIQAAIRDGLREPEVRELALTLLKSLSNMEFFKADRIGAKDLKDMGWDFQRYLAGNIKQDTPDHRTTVPESFARGAVKVFPEEAEVWTKETLKGEPVDTDSPYLRSIYCAINFLLLDSKKYACFQETINRHVQDSYAGYLKDPAYKPKYYALRDLINDYRPASAEILKVFKQLSEEQKADMVSKNSWGALCDELELPDFTYPLMIIREQAFTPIIDDERIPVAAFFTDMLKTNPDRFIHTYEKLLEEKDPWLLRLIKIVHVTGAGKELKPRCDALIKAEGAAEAAFWTQIEKSSASDWESPFLESLAAASRLRACTGQYIEEGSGYRGKVYLRRCSRRPACAH